MPGQKLVTTNLHLPDDLNSALERAAVAACRSRHMEIIYRLRESIRADRDARPRAPRQSQQAEAT